MQFNLNFKTCKICLTLYKSYTNTFWEKLKLKLKLLLSKEFLQTVEIDVECNRPRLTIFIT